MEFPIEKFGWNLIDDFLYSDGRHSYVFQRDGIKIIFIQQMKFNLKNLQREFDLSEEREIEAFIKTQDLINQINGG